MTDAQASGCLPMPLITDAAAPRDDAAESLNLVPCTATIVLDTEGNVKLIPSGERRAWGWRRGPKRLTPL